MKIPDTKEGFTIRPATPADRAGVLELAREIVRDGTTYVFAENTPDEELLTYWYNPSGFTCVCVTSAQQVAGMYLIKPNQPGRGAHVANGSYAVSARFQGHGLGKWLGEHSLQTAREKGFLAMQFNLVVSTNAIAVRLWEHLGFRIIGTLPKAFRHPSSELMDAYVMHRFL